MEDFTWHGGGVPGSSHKVTLGREVTQGRVHPQTLQPYALSTSERVPPAPDFLDGKTNATEHQI